MNANATVRFFARIAVVLLTVLLSACSTTMPVSKTPTNIVAPTTVVARVENNNLNPTESAKANEVKPQPEPAKDARSSEVTDTVKVKRPLSLATIGKPGTPLSTYALGTWQSLPENRKRRVTKVTPVYVVKDDAQKLDAWMVTSVPSRKEDPTFFDYKANENPIIFPENISADDVIKEVWPGLARELKRSNLVQDPQVIAANTEVVDGQTRFYGIWYSYKDDEAKFAYGRFQSVRHYSHAEMAAGQYGKDVARLTDAQIPMPSFALKDPERYVLRIPNLGETVRMAPFKVSAADVEAMAKVLPLIAKKDGRVIAIGVTAVLTDTPAAAAGLNQGMLITSVNGHEVFGLTGEEARKLLKAPFEGDYELVVLEKFKLDPATEVLTALSDPRTITIPRSELIKPVPEVKPAATGVVAATTPDQQD